MPNPQIETSHDFYLERYKYILQEIRTVNDNVYRFLGLYQTLATSLFTALILLFATHQKLGIDARSSRAGVVLLMSLISVVAIFAIVLIVSGIANWIDYRTEECALAKDYLGLDFRSPPVLKNMFRWYETYIILFILATLLVGWLGTLLYIVPRLK